MPTRVNPRQIAGVEGQTLTQDLTNITDKARTYDRPVATSADLPVEGNQDGDVRLVLNENRFYIWDEPTSQWVPDEDHMTEARTIEVPISADNQTIFNTTVPVGVENGIASLDTIVMYVNGMAQNKGVDYNVSVSALETPTLNLEWISTDFDLDFGDKIHINYDKLIIK